MLREMLKSKIHNATVTEANLDYVGSITIARDLMEAANLLPYEKVSIANKNNGARFETYVIEGEPGSGTICLNGAAARLVQPGDCIIIFAYAWVEEPRLGEHLPRIVILGKNNEIADQVNGEVHGAVVE